MPIMSPGVQALLRKAGVEGVPPVKAESGSGEQTELQSKMELAGLGIDAAIENLSNIASNSLSEVIRLRATETALKMHGALKESNSGSTAAAPSFTLVIQDSGSLSLGGVNPIFLPRQLLSKIKAATEEEPTVQ